jgi:hypothetical protein
MPNVPIAANCGDRIMSAAIADITMAGRWFRLATLLRARFAPDAPLRRAARRM